VMIKERERVFNYAGKEGELVPLREWGWRGVKKKGGP